MVATGQFELLEVLEIAFDMAISEKPISILPDDMPVEIERDDFTMRIVRADKTASTCEVIVEAVFMDEETANRYRQNNNFYFIAMGDAGRTTWGGGSFSTGAYAREPQQREDGTWVCEYIVSLGELLELPEGLTIIPVVPNVHDVSREGAFVDRQGGIRLQVR